MYFSIQGFLYKFDKILTKTKVLPISYSKLKALHYIEDLNLDYKCPTDLAFGMVKGKVIYIRNSNHDCILTM